MEGSTYDRKSAPGGSTDLSAFSLPMTDVTIQDLNTVTYYPVASLGDNPNCIEFNISSSDKFLDLSNTVLNVEGKIAELVPKQGTPAGENVPAKLTSVIDNLLPSLFQMVDVYVNDVHISHQDNYFISAYLNTLLNATQAQQDHTLDTQWFQRIKAGLGELLANEGAGAEAKVVDPAMTNRMKKVALAAIYLSGRLDTPLTNNSKLLPPGCNVVIKLYPSKSDIHMLENATEPLHRFKFTTCTLTVKHVTVPDAMKASNEVRAVKNNFIYALDNYDLRLRQMTKDSSSAIFEKIGPIYDRMYVAFVKTRSLHGDRATSPLIFPHLQVRNIKLTRGAHQYTYDNLHIGESDFGLTYTELQRSLAGPNVPFSVNHFKNDTFIIPFNLAMSNPAKSLPARQENTCRLEVEFAAPLTEEYIALFYTRRPIIMEIDAKRNVTIR